MISIDFSELRAEEILDETFINEYRESVVYFSNELVELNTIIYLVEKILDFPFHIFKPVSEENLFFIMVMDGFYNIVILLISRLLNDHDSDFFSLLRFKNQIRKAVKEKYKLEFDRLLKKASFSHELQYMIKEIRKLRNNAIAHKTKNFIFDDLNLLRPNIDHIREFRDKLNGLFDILAFDVKHMFLPFPNLAKISSSKNIDRKTDIDEILDCIAKNSNILNLPETDPEIWPYVYKRYSKNDLQIINDYRKYFHLPAVTI